MQATLDQMIQYTARQTKRNEDVVKTGDTYTDEDALLIVNKYIDGFNYAKNKILRERYMPTTTETVTVSKNNTVDMASLSKVLFKVKAVYHTEMSAEIMDWRQGDDFTIRFPEGTGGTSIDIEYTYMIPDFPNDPTADDLAVVLAFPEAIVDYRILCNYACYEYHLIKGSDKDLVKTGFFLNKWNDGFLHIPKSVKGIRQVKDRARY